MLDVVADLATHFLTTDAIMRLMPLQEITSLKEPSELKLAILRHAKICQGSYQGKLRQDTYWVLPPPADNWQEAAPVTPARSRGSDSNYLQYQKY